MKKNPSDEELQKLWDENIGALAYDLEEAFLKVFRKKGFQFQKPAFYLGSIAMAAGHVLQATEKEFDYTHDFKPFFDDVLKQSYDHYRKYPSDEQDFEALSSPNVDLSMLN